MLINSEYTFFTQIFSFVFQKLWWDIRTSKLLRNYDWMRNRIDEPHVFFVSKSNYLYIISIISMKIKNSKLSEQQILNLKNSWLIFHLILWELEYLYFYPIMRGLQIYSTIIKRNLKNKNWRTVLERRTIISRKKHRFIVRMKYVQTIIIRRIFSDQSLYNWMEISRKKIIFKLSSLK